MTANIEDLEQGAKIRYAGANWIILEPLTAGILLLSDSIMGNKAFNEDTDQNWKNSSIKPYLNEELLDALIKAGASKDDMADAEIDLKALDNDSAYGKDLCKVELLTNERYNRLKEYIPPADETYWLATPYTCNEFYVGGAYSHFVRIVRPDGSLEGSTADGGLYGIRPVICLKRGTVIEVVKSQIHDNVVELKGIVGTTSPITFNAAAKTLITDTVTLCNTMEYVTDTLSQARTYAQSMAAEQVYFDILAKIVNGTSITHMTFAVYGLIPVLKEKIKAEEQ